MSEEIPILNNSPHTLPPEPIVKPLKNFFSVIASAFSSQSKEATLQTYTKKYFSVERITSASKPSVNKANLRILLKNAINQEDLDPILTIFKNGNPSQIVNESLLLHSFCLVKENYALEDVEKIKKRFAIFKTIIQQSNYTYSSETKELIERDLKHLAGLVQHDEIKLELIKNFLAHIEKTPDQI
ncbi:hypothetical protein BN1013_00550 [Candidatus Rubidus massiliensis]|nr:hypothetical protein BN1013_00550 [Candidatus Rubidus massiliensis]